MKTMISTILIVISLFISVNSEDIHYFYEDQRMYGSVWIGIESAVNNWGLRESSYSYYCTEEANISLSKILTFIEDSSSETTVFLINSIDEDSIESK